MRQKIGMQTEMDKWVGQWLAEHHVTDKDVISWSATGARGDMTSMSITFFVSGVDEMSAADAAARAVALDRLWRALLDHDVLPDWVETADQMVDVVADIVDEWRTGRDKAPDTPDMSTDNRAETPAVVQQYLAEPVTVQMEAVTEPRWADLTRPAVGTEAVASWLDKALPVSPGTRPRPIKDSPQA